MSHKKENSHAWTAVDVDIMLSDTIGKYKVPFRAVFNVVLEFVLRVGELRLKTAYIEHPDGFQSEEKCSYTLPASRGACGAP